MFNFYQGEFPIIFIKLEADWCYALPPGVLSELSVSSSGEVEAGPHPQTSSGPYEGTTDSCLQSGRCNSSRSCSDVCSAAWAEVLSLQKLTFFSKFLTKLHFIDIRLRATFLCKQHIALP